MKQPDFLAWRDERDKAAMGTLEDFKLYMHKMGCIPTDPAVYEITYHKVRIGITSLPPLARETSRKWLDDRGYTSYL